MGVIQISDLPEGNNGILGIWELNDSSSTLLRDFRFSEKEQAEFAKISNERRKCEFLSIRLLLQNMTREKKELHYTISGKPFLKENLHISISHSSELAVVLLTDKAAGIDVENLQRNTDKIAPRFLSDTELQHINSTPSPAYTRIFYWSAKEALFKCTTLEGINFKDQIFINPFLPSSSSGKFNGQLVKNNRNINFAFYYCVIKNNAIVYCIEKESY